MSWVTPAAYLVFDTRCSPLAVEVEDRGRVCLNRRS